MLGSAGRTLRPLLLLLLAHLVGHAGARSIPQIRNVKRGYLVLNYDNPLPPINPSLLTAQVCAIIGSYIVVVGILLTFLFTVGRRLRRGAQASPSTLEVEMVKPANLLPLKSGAVAHEPSPISPPSAVSPSRSWFKSLRRSSSNASASLASGPQSPTSPGVTSVASFDRAVLERDRENRESEMDRLYAAVAEHEAKQAAKSASASVDGDRQTSQPTSPHTVRRPLAPLNTTAGTGHKDVSPVSAASPRSPVKAIYPPDSPARFAPPHPSNQYPSPMSTSPPRNVLRRESQTSVTSSSSKKTRKALRNLRISAPMQKYPGEAADDEARTPLSPRFYSPGPPPEPPSATSTNPQPHTPHTPADVDPTTAYEQLDEPRPLPSPAPQRGYSHSSNIGFSPVESPAESRRPAMRSANNSSGTLPLRDTGSDYAPAKTTLLSPRKDRFHALRSAGGTMLRSPQTGVPATPYSPYMPFTPITPVTPHLVTKQERKQRKKQEGKRVAIQEDMVQDSKDMWD